jgi:hypothetical protein
MKRVISALVIGLGLVCPATADTLAELKKFDGNGNGRIDAGRELDVYLLHKASPIFAKYDVNHNGILDAAEIAAIHADARKSVTAGAAGARRDEIIDDIGGRPGIPLVELARPEAAKEKNEDQRWFIRRDKTDISVASRPIVTPDANGARVSFQYDGLTRQQTWTADGVVSYILAKDTISEAYQIQAAIVPWAEFHTKFTNTGGGKNSGKLGFGTDAEFELAGLPGDTVHYLTLGASYQTDRFTRASIFDAAAKWQPFNDNLKLGAWWTIVPGLQFNWAMSLDATYRAVENSGSYALAASDYFWVGGWAKGFLRYNLDDKRNIVLTVQYDRRRELQKGRDAGLWQTELQYPLDAAGMTSVSIQYKRGREWSTLENFDLVTAGFNFKL